MAGFRTTFTRSFYNAIDSCFKARSLGSFISPLEISRLTLCSVSLVSRDLTPDKYSVQDWPRQHTKTSKGKLFTFFPFAETYKGRAPPISIFQIIYNSIILAKSLTKPKRMSKHARLIRQFPPNL